MKKIISVVLASMLVLCLAGCGDSDESSKTESGKGDKSEAAGTAAPDEAGYKFPDESVFDGENDITLNVSVPENAVDVFKAQVNAFVEHYPNLKMDIKVTDTNYNEASALMLDDPQKQPDVFYTTSDMLGRLMSAEMLSPVPDTILDDIKTNNDTKAVKLATADDKLYAYPVSCGNSCCLVYDKSVVSDAEAATLEGVLNSCKSSDRQFAMDCSNCFFSGTFTFTGGVIPDGFEDDGTTQKFLGYDEDEAVDTLMAFAKLMKEYRGTFVSEESVVSIKNNKTAAWLMGAWDLNSAKEALGDNLGVAKYPTIRVNNEDKQMISMQGYSFLGVHSGTYILHKNTAHALAYFLSSEECQRQRMEALEQIPSNLTVMREVAEKPYMKAFIEQSDDSVPLVDLSGAFFVAIGKLGDTIYDENWIPDDKEATRTLLRDTISKICE